MKKYRRVKNKLYLSSDYNSFQYRSCTSKVKYTDEGYATYMSFLYRKRVYHCKFCDGYHLTSSKK